MTGLAFQDPAVLAALLALPLLAFLHHRRRPAALRYSRLPSRAAGSWRLHLPFYLRLLALALFILALARPQQGFAWEESLTEGIDIQIALDISASMGAEDFKPENRLAVAKQVVRDFIAGRTGDRIGLVVFAGTASTRAPLTTDRRMLDELVDTVRLHELPDGTAIGVGLATAAARLKDSEARSRVIILVTDGVNNAGAIDPAAAAAICEGLGLRVYTIGVGRGGRVPVPLPATHPITGERVLRRVLMTMDVDHEVLQAIAKRTGGRAFEATDEEALAQIFAAIDRLETTPLEVKRYVRYREAFPPFAWAGLALLALPLLTAACGWTVEP
ncbi:MAG: VWA domain-containing protein [Thermoanaerobaculia bacterium]